jgi:hypothetical protein
LFDLGANPLIEPVFGDERAPDGLEETLVPWIKDTVDVVLPHLAPPPEGFQELATTDLPPPLYRIDYLDDHAGGVKGHAAGYAKVANDQNGTRAAPQEGDLEDSLASLHINGNSRTNGHDALTNGTVSAAPTREADTPHGVGGVWKPDDWQWATLRRNERVTREDWWQEVREFDFELDDTA